MKSFRIPKKKKKKGVVKEVECAGSLRQLVRLSPAACASITTLTIRSVDGSTLMPSSVDASSTLPSPTSRLSALRDSLQRLAVTRASLTVLPPCVLDLCGLTSLSLVHNRLVTLPSGFDTALPQLRSLHLDHNAFVSLDLSVCRLNKLERLSICHNQLSSLPDEIGLLVRLVELEADDNDIGPTLPDSVADLKLLRVLGLANNRLSRLPKALCTPYTPLTDLRLTGNLIPPMRPSSGGGGGAAVEVVQPAELPAFVRVAAKEEEASVRAFLSQRAQGTRHRHDRRREGTARRK